MVTPRIQKHLNRLQESRARLETVLDQIPTDQWEQQIYGEGAQWTIRQLLLHLMIADRGHVGMVKGIALGKEIIPPDYDLERFNHNSVSKQAETTIAEARAALTASRAELIAWLESIEESVLDLEGRHATLQILSIAKILNVMAYHELAHTHDLEAFLAQVKEN